MLSAEHTKTASFEFYIFTSQVLYAYTWTDEMHLCLQVLEVSAPAACTYTLAMGYPTLVTPMHCSDVLREWVSKLTEADHEKLRTWGIPSKLLKAADVEVSRHLLCAAARFWKPAHHVFCFGRTELTPTLEEVRQICGFSKIMGPLVFMKRDGYIVVLSQLTGLSAKGCQQRLIYTSGPTPLLRLGYFDYVMEKHAELGSELWLWGFVTRFLGELIFMHGWMTVAIDIAEIALAVVT